MGPRGGGARQGAIGLLAWHDLRHRSRTVLAIGLLFGVVAGVGLGCVAGARRTASLFERHLVATDAADVEIDPGQFDPESDRALRALPEVVDASWWATVTAFPLDDQGQVDPAYAGGLSFTTDGRYLDMDRVVVTDGRRLDPDQPDEIMLNRVYASLLRVGVGDRVPIGYVPADDDGIPTTLDPTRTVDAEVVGIMALNEDLTAEILDQVPRLFVSPAFRPPDDPSANYVGFAWYGLELEHGRADSDAVIHHWQAEVSEHNAGVDPGGPGQWLSTVHRVSDVQRTADRSVRPLAVAVGAFGVLATLAAVVLAAQALGRAIRERSAELRLARVLGLRPRAAEATALAVPVAVLVLAMVTAAVTALALSTRFPAGPYGAIEPHPGLNVDLAVLLPGLALIMIVPLAAASVVARREARGSLLERAPAVRRPSALVDRLARSGSPVPLVAATRFTVESGRGRSYVPVRSVVVSSVVIVATIATTLVFGANLDAVDADPTRFGWQADGALLLDGGYGRFVLDDVATWVDGQPDVLGWQPVGADRTAVEGRETPGLVYGQVHGHGGLDPVLIEGRAPERAGEVVLGRATLDAVGAGLGDTVRVGTGDAARPERVVGIAVFPDIGPVIAVRTGLDEGIWVHRQDLDVFDVLAGYGSPWNALLLRLRPGTQMAAINRAADGPPLNRDRTSVDGVGVIRPSEVTTAADASRYQPALVGVLAAAALLSMLLILLAVVRRRRHDLAVYRVMGFTPRQLRATMGLQGLLVAVAAVLVGLPVGLVLGRQLWQAFADDLGVVPDPSTPWGPLLATAAGILVIGVVATVWPAVVVTRRRSAASRLDPE